MPEPASNLDARVALLHKLPDAVRIRTALVGPVSKKSWTS